MAEGPRCVVLASGSGTNLQALLDEAAAGRLGAEIAAVVGDRPEAGALERARSAGVPARPLEPAGFPEREAYDWALADTVTEHGPDLVVLAGFMRLLSPEFVGRCAGRLINLHPSLLPAFRGLHTHRRALEAGCRIHGTTVHFVTDELDAGPIIAQAALAVRSEDSPETLADRVKGLERRLLPQSVRWLVEGRVQWAGTRVTGPDPSSPAEPLFAPPLEM